MAYQVALLNFEGPLDLLLQLVERARLSASELSLATLTEQYLEHMTALASIDADETSRFADLAARLLYIKSRALLPTADQDEEDTEVAELREQLETYGAYRDAAAVLAQLLARNQRGWSRTQRSQPTAGPAMPPNLSLQALQRAFASAVAKTPPPTPGLPPATVTLEEMTERLLQRSSRRQDGAAATLQAFFAQLPSRAEITVAFLAALELWRRGQLRLTQAGQFSIIQIDYATTHPST
jgi:segregation and condensation protein A